jgi:long-chain acyl-CoA synthetase
MVLRKLLFYRVHQKLGAQLRFLVSGGAPLEPELAHRWELLGIPVLQGYGTTEASPVIAGTSFRGRKSGSVGKPISAVELKISEDGELLIRGPGVTQGYWHNPQATREAFRDGWYCTGDLGYLDSQGFLFLHGRRKDLIVLANGQNVYPEDIERVLKQVPGVADAVVLGVPSPRGDRVHAALICQSESEDVRALVRRANLQLASQQQIQDFSLWPDQEFPKTHTLKVKKQEVLQGILAAQTDLPLTGPGTAPRTREESPLWRVVANLAGVPEGDITKQTTLGTDLGLDSLARVDLLSAIEAEFGTYVDESQIDVDTTVGQLQELVNSQPLLNPPDFKVWPLTGWSRLIRGTLQAPLFLALSAVAPARVSGLQVLQDLEPPVLFAVNHTSHLDTPTLLRVLPRPWRKRVSVAAAADYFFTDSLLGAAVALVLNAFPFSRTTAIRPTLQHSAWLMDHGWSILIYPEGTRTNTGDIQSFKSGVGLLAVELGAPVVPIRTEGLFNILPKGQSIPRPGRVTVNVGPPIKFDRQISYEQATSIIERAVRDIHPPGSPAPEDRSTGNPPEIRE